MKTKRDRERERENDPNKREKEKEEKNPERGIQKRERVEGLRPAVMGLRGVQLRD